MLNEYIDLFQDEPSTKRKPSLQKPQEEKVHFLYTHTLTKLRFYNFEPALFTIDTVNTFLDTHFNFWCKQFFHYTFFTFRSVILSKKPNPLQPNQKNQRYTHMCFFHYQLIINN